MNSNLVATTIYKIMQSRFYTLFILSAGDKKFGVYADQSAGENIQNLLAERQKPRPMTHSLIEGLLKGLDVTLIQTVFYEVEKNIYFCKLFFEQTTGEKKQIVEIDSRPSDSLTLSLMNDAPIFCTKELLDKVEEIED